MESKRTWKKQYALAGAIIFGSVGVFLGIFASHISLKTGLFSGDIRTKVGGKTVTASHCAYDDSRASETNPIYFVGCGGFF